MRGMASNSLIFLDALSPTEGITFTIGTRRIAHDPRVMIRVMMTSLSNTLNPKKCRDAWSLQRSIDSSGARVLVNRCFLGLQLPDRLSAWDVCTTRLGSPSSRIWEGGRIVGRFLCRADVRLTRLRSSQIFRAYQQCQVAKISKQRNETTPKRSCQEVHALQPLKVRTTHQNTICLLCM